MRIPRIVLATVAALFMVIGLVLADDDVRGYLDSPSSGTYNRYALTSAAGWAWDCYGGSAAYNTDVWFVNQSTSAIWYPDEGSFSSSTSTGYRPDAGAYLRGTGTCSSATDYLGFSVDFGYGDNGGWAIPPAGTYTMVVLKGSSYGSVLLTRTVTITE